MPLNDNTAKKKVVSEEYILNLLQSVFRGQKTTLKTILNQRLFKHYNPGTETILYVKTELTTKTPSEVIAIANTGD